MLDVAVAVILHLLVVTVVHLVVLALTVNNSTLVDMVVMVLVAPLMYMVEVEMVMGPTTHMVTILGVEVILGGRNPLVTLKKTIRIVMNHMLHGVLAVMGLETATGVLEVVKV